MKYIKIFVFAFIVWTASTTSAFAQTSPANETKDNLKTAIVKVNGITCATDVKTIAANVEKVKGVSSFVAEKQGPTTTFKVKYNPALITEEEIFVVIESTQGCKNPNEFPYKVRH